MPDPMITNDRKVSCAISATGADTLPRPRAVEVIDSIHFIRRFEVLIEPPGAVVIGACIPLAGITDQRHDAAGYTGLVHVTCKLNGTDEIGTRGCATATAEYTFQEQHGGDAPPVRNLEHLIDDVWQE